MSTLWDVVRRLRLFAEAWPLTSHHALPLPAHSQVRRLRLFTEDWPLLSRNGHKTSTAGLWDQVALWWLLMSLMDSDGESLLSRRPLRLCGC